jgi:uncharacterized protein
MCGDCCSTMGEVITILEKTGETEFRIGYSTTLEERIVTLDPDKQVLFFIKNAMSTMACPFLREIAPGRVICTVHSSRPELCRQYSCFRILILDANGKFMGRVIDKTRYFTTMDPHIREIWQRECQPLEIREDTVWEEEVGMIFTRAGYRVVK